MVFNASFLRMPIDTDVKKCWRRSLKTCKQNICISHSGHAALFSFFLLFIIMRIRVTGWSALN